MEIACRLTRASLGARFSSRTILSRPRLSPPPRTASIIPKTRRFVLTEILTTSCASHPLVLPLSPSCSSYPSSASYTTIPTILIAVSYHGLASLAFSQTAPAASRHLPKRFPQTILISLYLAKTSQISAKTINSDGDRPHWRVHHNEHAEEAKSYIYKRRLRDELHFGIHCGPLTPSNPLAFC